MALGAQLTMSFSYLIAGEGSGTPASVRYKSRAGSTTKKKAAGEDEAKEIKSAAKKRKDAADAEVRRNIIGSPIDCT